MHKKILSVSAVSLLIAAIFMTGCSGLKNSNKTKSIKIGVILPLSGTNSNYGLYSKMALDLLAEKNNEDKSSDDTKIEFVYEDDQNSTDAAANSLLKLVNDEKITALIGSSCSDTCLEIAPIANEKKIPMITPSATNSKVTSAGKYIFRACYTDAFQGVVIAKFAYSDLKTKRAAVIFNDADNYSIGLSNIIKDNFEKAGGVVVLSQSFKDGEEDLNQIVENIKSKNADIIILPAYYESANKIIKAIRQNGIKVPVIGGDGLDSDELIKIGRDYLDNVYFVDHFSNEDPSMEAIKFKNDFKAKYKSDPNAFAALAYDSGNIMIDAVKSSKSGSGDEIRAAIANTDFQGVTGEIKFDDNGDPIKKAVIIKIEKGKRVYIKYVNP